jgi:segregation and condensation protein B
VSSNIVRTLIERGWIRVVGFRDVPGKPSMLGTTREFLDYFGLRKLDDLPTLAEIKDTFGTMSPQEDFLETLEAVAREQTRARVENAIDDSADDGAQVADASNGREVDEGERAAAAWKATAAFGAGVTEADVDATDEGQEADEGAFAGDSSAVADDEATVADDGGMIADGASGREPAASAAVDVRRGPTTSATDDERGGRGPTTSAADDERGGHGPAASAADDERGGHGPAASAADDERGPPGDEAHESRRAAADDPRNGVTDDFDGDASAVSNVVPLTQSETH